MSTSAEIREARRLKEYLRILRTEEVSMLKRLADARALHEENPEVTAGTFAAISKFARENLADVRKKIEETKAVLATKVHINTKAEARKVRQEAAKHGRRAK
jgi:hypothetical protein